MKCPNCSYNQKVKDGLICNECRYRFSFNPRESATRGMTDGRFLSWVRAASQNDTAYFTRNQLFGVYCRRTYIRPRKYFWDAIVATVIGAIMGFFIPVFPPLVIAIPFVIFKVFQHIYRGFRAFFDRPVRSDFDALLNKWESTGQKIERMIEEPALHEPPPEWKEPDIYDYGVERLMIVERDLLVDLYVRNGIHAEQRMLIVSESGYPSYLMPIAKRLLEEQPELPVFLLHDATDYGVKMEERVMATDFLPLEGHPITDLGMFPKDFKLLKRLSTYGGDAGPGRLPVDAMAMPFMAMAVGAAVATGYSFSEIRDGGYSDSGGGEGSMSMDFDFG